MNSIINLYRRVRVYVYRMDKQSNTNHLFCVEYIILIYIILSYLGYFSFCTFLKAYFYKNTIHKNRKIKTYTVIFLIV